MEAEEKYLDKLVDGELQDIEERGNGQDQGN